MSGFRMYRMFDLAMLSLLAVVAEGSGILMAIRYAGAGFYLSFSSLVVLIALLRWRHYGVIVSMLTAVPMLLLNGEVTVQLLLYYLLSNSAVGLVPLLFKRSPVASIVENSPILFSYMVCYYGLLLFARGLCGTFIGLSFVQAFVQTMAPLSLSIVMTFIFLIFLRKKEGLLVDMTTYTYKEVIQE